MNKYSQPKKKSHAELLKLIGEIDGIRLESNGKQTKVYLDIHDKSIEIISDSSENICHYITRYGLAHLI